MRLINRLEIFDRVFRKDKFTDFDIKVIQEEGKTFVDDIADDFNAGEWKSFENNEKLKMREFITS
jgi:hypothetical protein